MRWLDDSPDEGLHYDPWLNEPDQQKYAAERSAMWIERGFPPPCFLVPFHAAMLIRFTGWLHHVAAAKYCRRWRISEK